MSNYLIRLLMPVLFFSMFLSAQDYNDIDAVSSASGKYKITGGKAYSDNAELNYSWRYANGTMAIKWGTTSSMTDGSQSISVFPPSGKFTINSLEPNSLYYFKLTGTWAGMSYSNLGSGTFTTASDGAVTFSLTVESGSGSGDYEEGDNVTITAADPSSGQEFDAWTGDISYVEDVNSSTTVFTMPANDAMVTATYKDIVVEEYALTVISGSGSGSYVEGEEVSIAADNAPDGQEFDKWTGDVSDVADVNSASTKITMPANDITITATYKDVIALDKYSLTVESGSGGGEYYPGDEVTITANDPASGKVFDKWTGDISNVANVNSASTKVTMPSENISVTATYKEDVVDPVKDNYLKITSWESELEGLGSTAELDTSDLENNGLSSKLYLKATVDTNYTWAKVSGYNDGNFSNITEITIAYTSDKDINIILEQEELSDEGTAYEYKLSAATDTTVTVSISDFAQPDWVAGEAEFQKDLDLTKILGISFAAIEENAEVNFQITGIFIKGYEGTPIVENANKGSLSKDIILQKFTKEEMVLNIGQSGSYSISVFSLAGRLVYSSIKNFQIGNSLVVDFGAVSLSGGIHLINITNKKNSYTFKAIVK